VAIIFGTNFNDTINPFFSTIGQFTTDSGDGVFGLAGNDELQGGFGNDTLFGGDNDDLLGGGPGNDSLEGEAGNDTLVGGDGADALVGGAGFNWAEYRFYAPFVGAIAYLASFAGNVNAAAAAGDTYSFIQGLSGTEFNDTLGSSYGASWLRGNEGDDLLISGQFGDTLDGGVGRDWVAYNGIYYASTGVSAWLGDASRNTGEAAGDIYFSIENVAGSVGNDTLVGDGAANVLIGLDGNDLIEGGAGADTLDGGAGINTVSYFDAGPVSVDLLNGGATDGYGTVDTLTFFQNVNGSDAGDFIQGNTAGNLLRGLGGNDRMFGNLGNDALDGGNGADSLDGGDANDTLTGAAGNDTMLGGAGLDQLLGGGGLDTLIGGGGADRLNGGGGADRIVYRAAAEGGDQVIGFVSGSDTIEIDASGFGGGLVSGVDLLAAERFVLGTAATRAKGQFLYDRPTGTLLWDADGTGGNQAVGVADFGGGTLLRAGDFDVVA